MHTIANRQCTPIRVHHLLYTNACAPEKDLDTGAEIAKVWRALEGGYITHTPLGGLGNLLLEEFFQFLRYIPFLLQIGTCCTVYILRIVCVVYTFSPECFTWNVRG